MDYETISACDKPHFEGTQVHSALWLGTYPLACHAEASTHHLFCGSLLEPTPSHLAGAYGDAYACKVRYTKNALWLLQLENVHLFNKRSTQTHFGSPGSSFTFAVQVETPHLSKALTARKRPTLRTCLRGRRGAHAEPMRRL